MHAQAPIGAWEALPVGRQMKLEHPIASRADVTGIYRDGRSGSSPESMEIL
jgi:hypothetical protein